MEYAIIIAVVAVIAAGVFIYMKRNKKNSTIPTIEETGLTSRDIDLIVSDTKKMS